MVKVVSENFGELDRNHDGASLHVEEVIVSDANLTMVRR